MIITDASIQTSIQYTMQLPLSVATLLNIVCGKGNYVNQWDITMESLYIDHFTGYSCWYNTGTIFNHAARFFIVSI